MGFFQDTFAVQPAHCLTAPVRWPLLVVVSPPGPLAGSRVWAPACCRQLTPPCRSQPPGQGAPGTGCRAFQPQKLIPDIQLLCVQCSLVTLKIYTCIVYHPLLVKKHMHNGRTYTTHGSWSQSQGLLLMVATLPDPDPGVGRAAKPPTAAARELGSRFQEGWRSRVRAALLARTANTAPLLFPLFPQQFPASPSPTMAMPFFQASPTGPSQPFSKSLGGFYELALQQGVVPCQF